MLRVSMRMSRLTGVTLAASAAALGNLAVCDSEKIALSPKEWRSFPVEKVETLSHDTKLFKIKLPSKDHEMGLVTASCLMVQGKSLDGTKDVARPYTPTTLNSQKGYFDLVIKKYPDGNVSSWMHNLKPGDSISVKGPFPKIKIEPNFKKAIGLIAGGTGVTPMYQVALEVLSNPADKTEVTLLLVNKTPEDILLKKELDALAAKHKNFRVIYKVDKPSSSWKGPVGHITPDDIAAYMPKPSDENLLLVCGPPGMMNFISGDKAKDKTQGELTGLLKQSGYKESQVYKM